MEELVKTANNILLNFLKIKKGKKILILKDEGNEIVDAFKIACKKNDLEFRVFQIPPNRRHSSPIPLALNEMQKADFIIAPTKNSVSYSPETTHCYKMGKIIITLPSITKEIFLKINKTDFGEIQTLNKKIIAFMKNKKHICITTPRGTKLDFAITNRPWFGDDKPKDGFIGNLPNGEAGCAPIEDSANGIIQIDYWADKITPKDGAWIRVVNGKIVDWNKEANPFIKMHGVTNGLIIAELGIGTNKTHKEPIGNILHDEKIYGTCHIAFGENVNLGGKNKSTIHSDIILLDPTILADSKKLII